MGRIEIGGRCSLRTSGTSTPSTSLDSREGSRPPLCSLNIVALPAQDEPTCICGRDAFSYFPNSFGETVRKASDRPARWACERPKGTFGPVRSPVYRSNPCSERCPYPFSDSFSRQLGE